MNALASISSAAGAKHTGSSHFQVELLTRTWLGIQCIRSMQELQVEAPPSPASGAAVAVVPLAVRMVPLAVSAVGTSSMMIQ
jgi:hypothetical protein